MSSNTISAANLDPTFRTIIQQTLEAERQPLKRLTARRDELQVQKAVYTDLSNLLNSLQSTLRSLISSQLTYTLGGSRSVKVTPTVAGSTVLSASAGSSAAAGSYEISVISLAKAHRVRSDAVEYINQALGLSGTLRLGGLAAAQVSGAALADGVTGFETSLPLDGKSALGSDAYYVETRQQDGVWQFRLVNSRGEAQFIRRSDGSYTSEWQNAPVEAGWVDTGRGLKIEFDPSALQARTRSSGASSVNYTPQGAAITVSASDSLVDIAAKINQAAYAEGNRVSAAVINNHLVLTHQRSGAGVLLQAADESGTVLEALGILQGGTFKTVLQTPSDAVFTVNGLTVQRGRNDKLSDVINGVSLSLSADAEGKSATLTIEDDLSADIKAVQTFLDQFNALQKYLSEKTATVKNSDNTYTRGALVGDSMFRSLRFDLLRQFDLQCRGHAVAAASAGLVTNGVHHRWVCMSQNQRAPGTDIVDVAVAIGIPEAGALAAFDNQRVAADGLKRAHRTIDPADEHLPGFAEDLTGARADQLRFRLCQGRSLQRSGPAGRASSSSTSAPHPWRDK